MLYISHVISALFKIKWFNKFCFAERQNENLDHQCRSLIKNTIRLRDAYLIALEEARQKVFLSYGNVLPLNSRHCSHTTIEFETNARISLVWNALSLQINISMKIRYAYPPARTRSLVKLIPFVIMRLLIGNERSEDVLFFCLDAVFRECLPH